VALVQSGRVFFTANGTSNWLNFVPALKGGLQAARKEGPANEVGLFCGPKGLGKAGLFDSVVLGAQLAQDGGWCSADSKSKQAQGN
jgi:hypothetical protein